MPFIKLDYSVGGVPRWCRAIFWKSRRKDYYTRAATSNLLLQSTKNLYTTGGLLEYSRGMKNS